MILRKRSGSGWFGGGVWVVIALLALGCGAGRAQAARGGSETLLLGAAWYPEQWPESRWDADLDLMQKAHLHVVRVGEFAWTELEPREGVYELDWLERAVRAAERHDLRVILGTPTAGPPVWMAKKYPEILLTESNGRRYTGATRNRYNWNSERYLGMVRAIDEKLAERFGHDADVIGWQIDNEYNSQSYDEATQGQFHDWLRKRYGAIEKLNAAWTTAYNNQTFSSFEEVPLTSGTMENSPGLWLDSKRFISDSLRRYQRVQIDALRRFAEPRQKITTNMMGWFDLYDHYTVAQDLNLVGWDNPQVQGTFDPVRNGAPHDLMRGLKGGSYWVLETTAGPRGGGDASVQLDKGALRAAIWADVGHGADLVSYWQWRDALNGGEANHGALVDVDGTPDPVYAEYAQVGREFERAGDALRGTTVHSGVAILHSYPSRWTVNWQKMNPAYDAVEALMSYYKPLHELGYMTDIVPPDRDLSSYQLVIAPALEVLTAKEAENLARYVRGGGHLVLGQRSAMKDEHNSRWPERQPGPLAGLLGARVEQFTALREPVSLSGTWGEAGGKLYAEQLTVSAPDVTVMMRYRAPRMWLDGEAAAVRRKVGQGSIAYIGAWMDDAAMKRAVEWMLKENEVKAEGFRVPTGVDVYCRSGAGKKIYVVENMSGGALTFALPEGLRDVLTGETESRLSLPMYGVAVLAGDQNH